MRPDIPQPCGGRGTCGRCKVRVLNGSLDVTDADRAFFSCAQLEAGWRLACQHDLPDDIEFEREDCSDEGFVILDSSGSLRSSDTDSDQEIKADTAADVASPENESLHIIGEHIPRHYDPDRIAVVADIGTTTVVLAAVDKETGGILTDRCFVNRQRAYGCDVIARIDAACTGHLREMSSIIRSDFIYAADGMLRDLGVDRQEADIDTIVVGNTAMLHIFKGVACYGLARYPFVTPFTAGQRFGLKAGYDCRTIPCLSPFVGADALAGIFATGMADRDDITLFIDLGTNGEIALGNKNCILTASVAAGPALEGGNISCGVGCIPGAVYDADYSSEDGFRLSTIGDVSPVGICGSGIVALISEALEHGLIDNTGLIPESLFSPNNEIVLVHDEKLSITQKDVREFQLASAAVRAAVDTMLDRLCVTEEDIDRIFIAGGFGAGLNINKAVRVGMLPPCADMIAQYVGNTSLIGAIRYLMQAEEIDHIIPLCTTVEMSDNPVFRDSFMKHLSGLGV